MDGIFKKFQQGATKAAGSFLNLFDKDKDTVAGKTAKTVGDFFEPQPIEEGIRVRDVAKHAPENLANVIGRPILRSFAALGKKASNADIRATYEPQTDFEKSMFGTDRPINFTSIGKEVRMAEPDAKTIRGLDPTIGGIIAMMDAPTGGRAGQAARATVKGGVKAYEGATNLTTKVLDDLRGKTSVSRQYIQDLLKRPDVKQAERDVVETVLRNTRDTGKVDVQRFADQVEEQLLPINVEPAQFSNGRGGISNSTRYENVNLPDDLRGPVARYEERIWQSPIKTRAGDIHFEDPVQGGPPNYFAHTRVEDLPDSNTRRIIELQSDLFQRGRTKESYQFKTGTEVIYKGNKHTVRAAPYNGKLHLSGIREGINVDDVETIATFKNNLEPFKNTWWQRTAREEIRDAARAGKTDLLFPTGKTAMQVEGLSGVGNRSIWVDVKHGDDIMQNSNGTWDIGPGQIVGNQDNGLEWMIIKGDPRTGKFQAVEMDKLANLADDTGISLNKLVRGIDNGDEKTLQSLTDYTESFDLNGALDKESPIFKFYEESLAKYLSKRFGAERFTDERGVEWMRVKVRPEAANQPVEAFAGMAMGVETDEEGDITGFDPLAGLVGAGAFAMARGVRGKKPGVGHTAKVLREVDESSVLLETGGQPVQSLKMPQDPTAVFYHGTTKANATKILNAKKTPATLHVGDLSEAGVYGDTLIEMRPAKGATIRTLQTTDPEWQKIAAETSGKVEDMHKAARAKGYDAIYAGDEIEILNPGKFEMAIKGQAAETGPTFRSVGDIMDGKQQKVTGDHALNTKKGIAEVPFSTRLDEAFTMQESEAMLKDARKLSYEDFVLKYEAYNLDRGGMSDGSKRAHAVITKDRLVPTEHLSWDRFGEGMTKQPNLKTGSKQVDLYMKKSFAPPLVEDAGDGFYEVIDGHHRIYNLIRGGNGDIPVYLDRRTLKNIWEKNSGKKVDPKKADALYKSFPEVPPTPKKTVGDIIKPPTSPTPTTRPPLRPKRDERRFTTRTRALEPGTSPYLSGAKPTRSTDELIAKADELIKTDLAGAESMAKTGTDDLAVAVASRLIDQYVNKATKAKNAANKEAMWEKAAEISNTAARNLTENGRAVQAASILGRNTPEGMVRFAAKFIQNHNDTVDRAGSPVRRTMGDIFGTQEGKQLKRVPNLTAEQAEQIVTRMREIDNLPTDEAKSIALQDLMDTVIKPLVPDSLYKKIYTVWKAGLLTGIKTTGLNIGSNISHYGSEIIKDVPAALVDTIVSLFTGKRTTAATLRGLPSGIKEGVIRGVTYFRKGYDARDVGAKLDYRRVHMGNSKLAKAIQFYEETVFRTHGTQDQPFYYGAKTRALYSQAIAQAKNKGLRGKEAAKYIDDLVANPTDDMLKYATLDAETSVFQQRTTLGQAAKKIQDIPGGQILLPFGKTPSAVATQIINYTPVGAVAAIARGIGKGRFDQRLFSQQMGRAITGTGAIYLGSELYAAGMMNLNMPTSQREREQWRMEGRVPNSIKMHDDEWRNPIVLGPAGLLLILGGQIQRGIDETGSLTGGMAMSAPGMVGTMTEQTFLVGINQALDAVKDPERSWQGYSSSLAGSVVPTIVADLARTLDDYERDAPTPGTRIQSRIPGVRENLEPRVNPFGEPTKTPDALKTMADATRPGVPNVGSENQNLVRELRRLTDAGYPATPTPLVPRSGYASLSPQENTNLRGYVGQAVKEALTKTFENPNYLRYDDEMRADVVNKAVRDAKVEARAYMVQSMTRGLTGDELNQRLAELKEDGILTQQVYKRYQQISR